MIGVVYAIEGLASLNVTKRDFLRATQLFAWTDAVRAKICDQRPPVEQGSVDKDLAVIQTQLSEKEFVAFSEKGRTMTTEQTIAFALEE